MKKIGMLALMIALGAACFAQNLPRAVVLPLENQAGDQYDKDVVALSELLASSIAKTRRVAVIERTALDAAAAAHGAGAWADAAKSAEMGRALNASYIVRGTVSQPDDSLIISARIFTITTAELRGSAAIQVQQMSEAHSAMNSFAQNLTYTLGILVQPTEPATQPVVFVVNVPVGALEIHTVTAGTLEISGVGIDYTLELPERGSLPPMTINTGHYDVTMHYRDGKTETKTADVGWSQITTLKFTYDPSPSSPQRLNTLGVFPGIFIQGTTFNYYAAELGFAGTVQGTYAPWQGSFFELGMDIGLGNTYSENSVDMWFSYRIEDYFSLHPFIRYAFFWPFAAGGGWYIGAGLGLFHESFTFITESRNNSYSESINYTVFTLNASAGVIFKPGITLSLGMLAGYGAKQNELVLGGKLTAGYSYRFKGK